ncbi:unnamed protein product [Acanthoscelides obtectus]|nr:unnamed protein product [Acanthoscelides obtectus]CAK1638056.1 hypothetical protein AOBTE_LOCUS10361 [Acanthoscelides obtectus]
MNFLKSTMLSLMGVAVKQENEASEMEEVEESNNESGNDDDESATITQPRATLSQNTKMSLLEQRLLGKPLTKPEPSNASKAPKNSKSEPKEDESQHPLVNSKNRMAYINTSIQASQLEAKKDLKEYEHEQPGMNTNIQKTSIETKKYQKEDETAQPVVNSSKRTVYVNSNDPSCCEICSKTWPAKKHLWQHYIRCHKAEAATVCGICLKMNKSYAALQVHLLHEHPTLLHGQGFGSKFICRVCGRYHNASSKLRLHMVIHENFDWKLLENVANIGKVNENPATNGLKDCKNEPKSQSENGINYDSLIEEVECSSESQAEDCDGRLNINKEDDSSSTDNEDSNDSVESAKSLPNGKLNGAGHQSSSSEDSSSCVSDTEGSRTGSSAEGRSTSGSQSSQSKKTGELVDSESSVFDRKSEELDTAIKSISYESIDQAESVGKDDVQMLPNCLNDNEIESAVDSIL